MAENITSKCPHCGSTNLSTEPVYTEREWEESYGREDSSADSQIALFCVTCGHFIGTVDSPLREKNRNLHSKLIQELGRE
jgi:uncharacterized Zn finger protein